MLFAVIAHKLRGSYPLRDERLAYYWAAFTSLTGFWEAVYVSQYPRVVAYAHALLETKTSVWSRDYSPMMVLPWNLARVFYAQYGAYADREYMATTDRWSRLIESTHALCAGLACATSLFLTARGDGARSDGVLVAGMGGQLMNSVLYLGQYAVQCNDRDSVNYRHTRGFPAGPLCLERPFMWVNALWTLLPAYILYVYLMMAGGTCV